MKKFWFVISLCLIAPAMVHAQTEKLKIVATNSIAADWIKNVAGDEVELSTFVGANGDVHSFEPTPGDNVLLSKANVVFEIGLGLEYWLNKLYAASGTKAKRIVLSKGVISDPLLVYRADRHEEDADPHVWHNVRYVIGMVKKIAQALAAADPERAKTFQSNADNYIKQLQELDRWVMTTTAQIPKNKRKIVANHTSMSYFCERYQFDFVGAAFESASAESDEPSAREMTQLILKVRKLGISVIFAENVHNTKVIESLAREAKVRLAPALFTDALGEPGSVADTYIKLVRYNTETIVSELLKD